MRKRIETAVRADLVTTSRILELSTRMDGLDEPQTEEELGVWVQEAQKIRAEMITLTTERKAARIDFLGSLRQGDSEEGGPLVESVIRYFEAENEYFRLAEKAQATTTVMVFDPETASPEDVHKLRAVSQLGDAVLKSYDALLACQQDMIATAGAHGLQLSPVWDPAEQESMLKSYKAMRDLWNSLERE